MPLMSYPGTAVIGRMHVCNVCAARDTAQSACIALEAAQRQRASALRQCGRLPFAPPTQPSRITATSRMPRTDPLPQRHSVLLRCTASAVSIGSGASTARSHVRRRRVATAARGRLVRLSSRLAAGVLPPGRKNPRTGPAAYSTVPSSRRDQPPRRVFQRVTRGEHGPCPLRARSCVLDRGREHDATHTHRPNARASSFEAEPWRLSESSQRVTKYRTVPTTSRRVGSLPEGGNCGHTDAPAPGRATRAGSSTYGGLSTDDAYACILFQSAFSSLLRSARAPPAALVH